MSQISRLSDEAPRASAQSYIQKWMKVFSTPIDREQVTTTVSALYQQMGYSHPKVVFLDSPLAVAIAAATLSNNAEIAQTRLHEQLLTYYERCSQQLLHILCNDVILNGIDPLGVRGFSPRVAEILTNCSQVDHYEYQDIVGTTYFWGPSELEETSIFVRDLFSIAICDQSNYWCNSIYSHQQFERLSHQIGVPQNLLQTKTLTNSKAIMPVWNTCIPEAAICDFLTSTGLLVHAEPFISFVNSAFYLECISPFEGLCFVSDRPQFRRNPQGVLHASGEPAIYFSDGFGLAYFYNGLKLPYRYGTLIPSQWPAQWMLWEADPQIRQILIQETPPNQWQAEWILKESNSQSRQTLIQGIGYARICQELRLEKLDSWREYILLKLPIYDDHGPAVTWRAKFQRPDEEAGAIYLLKMTCPSTGLVYVLRVPPNVESAREAATWVNWGIDPEQFTIET